MILEVHPSVATLLDLHRRPVRKAGNGTQGSGSNRNGAAGEDLVIRVPNGTVVSTEDGEVLADLIGAGTRFIAAEGGHGGLGNAALASMKRKAPGFALRGEPGAERSLVLLLKTVADAGLVGFPNAGKSSLIGALSAAKPTVGDYPFTTLTPHLGVVEAGDVQFVAADVPGLIPGASQGKGLGLEFLRHVERCAVLVHVLDCTAPESSGDTEPEPGRRLRRDRGRTRRLPGRYRRRPAGPAPDRGAEQDRRARRAGGSRAGRAGAGRPGAHGVPGVRGDPGRGPGTGVRAGRGGGRGPRGGPRRGTDPPGDPAAAGRGAGVRDRAGRGEHVPGPGRQTVALGSADRLRERGGRRATSPTGWPSSAWKKPWPRRARKTAPRS